jgi:hypothetical protein
MCNRSAKQTNKQTMATITMPREFDGAIQDIIAQARDACVQALAERFAFDPAEAQRFLEEGGIKVVKKRGPVPKAKKIMRTKKGGDELKPKRALTGYLLFSDDEREQVQAELKAALQGEAKLAPQAVVKELAARWKALGEDDRVSWNFTAVDASE